MRFWVSLFVFPSILIGVGLWAYTMVNNFNPFLSGLCLGITGFGVGIWYIDKVEEGK